MIGIVRSLDRVDRSLLHAVALRRRPFLDRWMRRVTRLGDPPVMLALGALLLSGWLPIDPTAARSAALGLLLAHLIGQCIKRSVSRARPSLPIGVATLIHPPDRFSFPSGHATAALAAALPVALSIDPSPGVLLLALALLVGLSRAYLGVHYLGDVLAGWAIAIAATLIAGMLV